MGLVGGTLNRIDERITEISAGFCSISSRRLVVVAGILPLVRLFLTANYIINSLRSGRKVKIARITANPQESYHWSIW